MFVEALKRQNPALISAALSLWQQGKIAPDSWVIDVDQILENGKRLIETARLYGIELYLMTKQFGRNPWLAEKLLALGYSGIVAVDYKEAHYRLLFEWSPPCHFRFGSSVLPDCRMSYQPQNSVCGYAHCRRN